MSIHCKNLPALKAYLLSLGAESKPIDYGEQFTLPSTLIVNVYDKGTITFQNQAGKEAEVERIKDFIEKLNNPSEGI